MTAPTATTTMCDGLLAKWGVTVPNFVAYNGDVNDQCTNLVVNQSVRVFLL
jgi:hypothetical protein